MRIIARLLLLVSCCLFLFVAGVLATILVNFLIYGVKEFDGNAGAKFSVFIEGIFVGLILGLFGVFLSIFLFERIPWLRDPK